MKNLELIKAKKRRRKALNVVFNELDVESGFGKNLIRNSIEETLNDAIHVVTHETKDSFDVRDMKEILRRLSHLRDIVKMC